MRHHQFVHAPAVRHPEAVIARALNQRCPCGKVYSPSRRQALRLLGSMRDRYGLTEPCYLYQCGHGVWHWTRAPHPGVDPV